MGQKINPKLFRLGGIYQWHSKWFSQRHFPELLRQDIELKGFMMTHLKDASVDHIEIERSANALTVIVYSAKPGMVIGRAGQGIDELKKKIQKKFLDPKTVFHINIQEVTEPNLSAQLISQLIVQDIEKRIPFRRAMKQVISRVEKTTAKGVKVTVAGRLNGSEIARTESLSSGSLPLHTLRADIDYAQNEAKTTYGVIGVKVWIYKGQKFAVPATEVAAATANPVK